MGLVLGVLLFDWLAESVASFAPEDAGLGRNTRAHLSQLDGRPISARGDHASTVEELAATFEALRRDDHPVVLWLGASQLHAINHLQPGQETAAYFANRQALGRGDRVRYLQSSSPNASLHDLLALYLLFRQRGLVPDTLVVAIVYDDLREDGMRKEILTQLDTPDATMTERFGPGIAHIIAELGALAAPARSNAPVERSALDGTPQKWLEDEIVELLDDNWSAFRSRGKIIATAKVAFNAGVASVRGGLMRRRTPPVPSSATAWNLEALDSLVAITRADDVRLLLYKQPHRPGELVFYHNRDAYDRFFDALAGRCESWGVRFLDLETIVPANYWGMTNGFRPDVFHFQEEGHRRLGAAIDKTIANGGG